MKFIGYTRKYYEHNEDLRKQPLKQGQKSKRKSQLIPELLNIKIQKGLETPFSPSLSLQIFSLTMVLFPLSSSVSLQLIYASYFFMFDWSDTLTSMESFICLFLAHATKQIFAGFSDLDLRKLKLHPISFMKNCAFIRQFFRFVLFFMFLNPVLLKHIVTNMINLQLFENILEQIFPLSNKKRIFVLKERKLYYGNT